jgi:curved DNA-binding protein CbpA
MVPPPVAARPGPGVIAPPPPPAAPVIAAVGQAAPSAPGPIPPSGPIDQLTATQVSQLNALAAELVGFDYFQVLKLDPQAPPAEIKKAFYRESRIYHPDRFFHLNDEKAKGSLGTIYKRITEAYYFLRDDTKRRKYAMDIAGPDRKNKLRFTEASESEAKAEVKKQAEEQIGSHPKGRSFFTTAMREVSSENWSAAERSLKTALTYEPSNARYKEELAKVQAKLHDAFKAKGDQFKIR